MNNKITPLKELAMSISGTTGLPEDCATRFITALFAQIQDCLAMGEIATVDGIGIFSLQNGAVEFIPDTTLAEAVNSPFSLFSPVQLPDNISDNIFEDCVPQDTAIHSGCEQPSTVEDYETECPREDESLTEETTGISLIHVPTEEAPAEEEPAQKMQTESNYAEEDCAPVEYRRYSPSVPWLTAAAGFIIGILTGYIIGTRYSVSPVQISQSPLVYPIDSAAEIVAEPEITVDSVSTDGPAAIESNKALPEDTATVYDTVTSSRFLTTIARDHYGRKDFWVFIYEANSDILRHPNRIRPGTRIVIPNLGENAATNDEMRKRAHRLANEIYNRYDL